MKIRRILKWTVGAIFVALLVAFVVAYVTSSNECDQKSMVQGELMKAVIYCDYGSPDVLKFENVKKPVPGDNEVLIKVRAVSLNPPQRSPSRPR